MSSLTRERRPMVAYASRTGTRRNLIALAAAGWRLLVSPAGCLRTEGMAYALDNGAWAAFKRGQEFDELARVRGCLLHVGRVNTPRRIRLCALARADSFDGSSASRYAKSVRRPASAGAAAIATSG